MKNAVFVLLAVILFASVASAHVLIGGIAYGATPASTVSGADVEITCNHNGLSTTSASDGSYAVVYDSKYCSSSDVIEVEIDGTVVPSLEYIVLDITDIDLGNNGGVTSTGGGSTRTRVNYYNCGNGICDSGESSTTCPADCKVETPEFEELSYENDNEEKEELSGEKEEKKSSGITGAVIGALSSPSMLGILAFVVIVIAVTIFVKARK